MRDKRESIFRSAVLLATFLLLFGVSGATAASGDAARVGSAQDIQSFLESLDGGSSTDDAYCESDCCWAACIGGVGGASCDSSGCSAWCEDGSTAEYRCNQE